MLERWDEAETHFKAALERCELLGARAVRPRVLREYARALRAREEGRATRSGPAAGGGRATERGPRASGDWRGAASRAAGSPTAREAGFAREGEFWTIGYERTTMRLRDVKGLRYIGFLLAAPGSEVHVLELVAADGGPPSPRADPIAERRPPRGRPEEPIRCSTARAKAEYQVAARDLRGELEEARGFADDERAAAIEQELDALVEGARSRGGVGRAGPRKRPRRRSERV